ncbi:MAG: thioredoxin family protein [Planctomycetes bacterium]|jgi:thiol:disulfide interchange protein|nr:thioredoxin family protein [Planctomycetota bacterium]
MITVLIKIALALLAGASLFAACSQSGTNGAGEGGSAPAADAAVAEIRGGSLRDALALGQRTGRNVLLEFYGEGCPYCRQMDKDALSDGKVKAALKEVVYVRMTKGRDADSFVQRFGEQVTPTFVAMKPDGSVLGTPVSGVVKAGDFARYVGWAKAGEGPMPNVSGAGG